MNTVRRTDTIGEELAVIPINDGVVFPHMLVPLVITDNNLISLIDEALAGDKIVGAFTQRDGGVKQPGPLDLYQVGAAMMVQKMARFPDGHVRIIGQGLARIGISRFSDDIPFIRAEVDVLREPVKADERTKALMRNVVNGFLRLVEVSENYPEELKGVISNLRDPGRLADLLAANLGMDIGEKQEALETLDPSLRLALVQQCLDREMNIADLGEKIRRDVHLELDREQREYYLRQQIRAIQKELGDDEATYELDELKDRIDTKAMPEHAREAAMREWNRLTRINPSSGEFSVSRTYVDWLLDLPWEDATEDDIDLDRAREILDSDHFDLDEVKERILEFLAVRKLKEANKGSIICFSGPPGVGKTSLGRSIARALGRKFVRLSLGGVKDEAEIRGHRRTYIGALPGRIIQGLRTAGSCNPVFMLDEIDKLGSDYKGDPSSALLEVLDPEQNGTFTDHYLGIEFDLSKILFITTANMTDTVPKPLQDRMEIIEISGYITDEKVEIARRFLVPDQLKEHGISEKKLEITDEALSAIIARYTREPGVRELERKIETIARKVARKLVEGKRGPYRVTPRNLRNYLGGKDYPEDEMLSSPGLDISTGMAKTSSGGTLIFIEALALKGNGRLKLTGHLGEVMKESAEAAMSFVRSSFTDTPESENFFENFDIHLHIPAGAVPKDGPSAGVAIAVALASLATGRKVRNDVAMTGEVTLTGKVLGVGAVKDKAIAAHRAGIREVILPSSNKRDIEDIPEGIRKEIRFNFVEGVSEGIEAALLKPGGKTKRNKGKRSVIKE